MKETLRIVLDGGLLSKGDLAEKVGVQESTLEDILSLLSFKGYLRKLGPAGVVPSGCFGCPIRKDCMDRSSTGSTYIITEKGKHYLEK